MFTSYYELFIGHLPSPTYRNVVFSPVGWITLLGLSLGMAVLFYPVLGRLTVKFRKSSHWFLLLTILMIAAFGFAVWYAHDATHSVKTDSYMVGFGFENLLLAVVSFFLFSLLLRRTSNHSRNVPF